MWIFIGASSGVVIALLWLFRPFHRQEELGTVSAEWLAEYRQNTEM